MTVARVRMRGLREIPLERMLFIVVLGCSLLLLSVVMLRSEQASGVTKAASRTFRDGFIVAQSESRRTEGVNGTVISSVSEKTSKEEATPSTGGTGPKVEVEQQGEHTMTKIKTEDGDEITIKRAANSNKITTISAHEDGKITIENREEDTKKTSGMRGAARETRAEGEDADATVDKTGDTEAEEQEEDRTRRAGYEKMAAGKENAPPLAEVDDHLTEEEDEELQRRRKDAEAAMGQEDGTTKSKKVTVVEVGRSLTKVSVQDVKEDVEQQKHDTPAQR